MSSLTPQEAREQFERQYVGQQSCIARVYVADFLGKPALIVDVTDWSKSMSALQNTQTYEGYRIVFGDLVPHSESGLQSDSLDGPVLGPASTSQSVAPESKPTASACDEQSQACAACQNGSGAANNQNQATQTSDTTKSATDRSGIQQAPASDTFPTDSTTATQLSNASEPASVSDDPAAAQPSDSGAPQADSEFDHPLLTAAAVLMWLILGCLWWHSGVAATSGESFAVAGFVLGLTWTREANLDSPVAILGFACLLAACALVAFACFQSITFFTFLPGIPLALASGELLGMLGRKVLMWID